MNSKRATVNGVLGLGIAAMAITTWAIFGGSSTTAAAASTVVTAKTSNVLSSVTGTGNVIVPSQLAVSFDSAVSSAKVTAVLVKVGDTVTIGQPLAKVDDTLTSQSLAAAQAQFAAAQAALAKAQNPATPTVVAQDRATANQASLSVTSAQAAVTVAEANLATDQTLQATAVAQAQQSLTDAQAKANQDLTTQQTTVSQAQAQLATDNTTLAAAQITLAGSPADPALQAAVNTAQAAVTRDNQAVQSALNSLASLQLSTHQSLEQATNNVTNTQNSAAAKLAADRITIDNANRQVASARASYQSTLAGNAVKEAAPTAGDLAGAQASLISAQNALSTAQRNETNTTLLAPASGTVTASTAVVGGPATGSSSSSTSTSSSSTSGASGLFTLDNLTSLQVKVGFSESDAANVIVGQNATVTFASLTGVTATGKVSQVDLTATTVSNVVTYYAYIGLDPSPTLGPVKPGMTATVQVVVKHADGVVSLPTSAVTARGNTATVNVEVGTDPKKTTPTQIALGLRGDSSIEIVSGLAAGQNVVVTRQTTTTGTGATVGGAGGLGGGAGGLGGGGTGGGAGRVGG